ncbi:MAG: phosphatidylinositol-specific phospholipase C/glycerophosphodiester phosphodiesterase family protein [Phreatobacter sp.]
MIIIRHRRNTLEELLATPADLGIEVDIRSAGSDLIIHHDPFVAGERFDDWLEGYRHGTLILNVKEEGLEDALLARMQAAGISDFFFLDQSFPFLVRTSRRGERRCAVRVSEFETVDTALTLAGSIDWVWVDCFTRFPLESNDARRLSAAGFKLCLVSPELQGRTESEAIPALRAELAAKGSVAEAVCTKAPEQWR